MMPLTCDPPPRPAPYLPVSARICLLLQYLNSAFMFHGTPMYLTPHVIVPIGTYVPSMMKGLKCRMTYRNGRAGISATCLFQMAPPFQVFSVPNSFCHGTCHGRMHAGALLAKAIGNHSLAAACEQRAEQGTRLRPC